MRQWLRKYLIGADLEKLERETTTIERLEGETAALSHVLQLYGEVTGNVSGETYDIPKFVGLVKKQVKHRLTEVKGNLSAEKFDEICPGKNVTEVFERAFRNTIDRFT